MEQIVTLVDTNVIIDIIGDDPVWRGWSQSSLVACAEQGSVAINQIVLAEIAAGVSSVAALDNALEGFDRLSLPWAAGYAAGQAFVRYRDRGGQRTSILPDFYIGAHAQVDGLRLLTRDATRFRTYFPAITIVAP